MAADSKNLVARFGRWVAWAVAAAVLLYVAGTVWAGFDEIAEQLIGFAWTLYIPVLLLTLVNYGGGADGGGDGGGGGGMQ